VSGLVEADVATSGKADLRHGSPPGLLYLRAEDAQISQRSHFCLQVIAHQIPLGGTGVRRMERCLRGW